LLQNLITQKGLERLGELDNQLVAEANKVNDDKASRINLVQVCKDDMLRN